MARPWPDRYTRARLGLLKGFIVRPRMGQIALNFDEDDVMIRHGGWAPPFTDADGEPNLADGVNPGEVVSLGDEQISNGTYLWTVQFEPGDRSGPRYNVNGESARRKGQHIHGVIDWRSADNKRVVSWVGMNRYSAPGAIEVEAATPEKDIWYKGRHIGTLTGGAVKGACIYVDNATQTSWLVVVTFKVNDATRENNDYTEPVWMRPLGRSLQTETTTPEDIDALILELEDPALSQAQKQEKLEELKAELDKWQQVAVIDADPLLPAPPTGDPKAMPLGQEVGNWLFNASGNECQTIRAVIADDGSEPDTFNTPFKPQDRRRLKINIAYTITEQEVAGTTIRRPAASIAQAQTFATLTGTVSTSRTVTNAFTDVSKEIRHESSAGSGSFICSGQFEDVRMSWDVTSAVTRDESYTLVFAVDYVGDQEVFGSVDVVRDKDDDFNYSGEKETKDECGDPQWAGNSGFVGLAAKESTPDLLNSYLGTLTDNVTETYDLNGLLLVRTSTFTEIETGPTGPSQTETWPTSLALDDDGEGLGIRWLDLRDGIAHVVETAAAEDDGDGLDKSESKEAIEKVFLAGAETTLQSDNDARTTSSGYGEGQVENDAFVSAVDDSSSEAATFQNLGLSAGNYFGTPSPSIGWAGNGEGVYVGSALLGKSFRPYVEEGFPGPGPHGHETTFNFYNGAADSIQDLFGIQGVNPGDEFVCYPLAFVGA